MDVFPILGLRVPPAKMMDAYAVLGLWAFGLVAWVLAILNSTHPEDDVKQKAYNFWTYIALFTLFFSLFFTLRLASPY